MSIVGDQRLLRTLFQLKIDPKVTGAVTVGAGAQVSLAVDVLKGAAFHGFYIGSVVCADNGVVIFGPGGIHVAGVGDTANASVIEWTFAYATTLGPPVETGVGIVINNHSAASRNLRIKVYRIAALV